MESTLTTREVIFSSCLPLEEIVGFAEDIIQSIRHENKVVIERYLKELSTRAFYTQLHSQVVWMLQME